MRILTFLLLLITGLGMGVPGLYLASLGGSFYYLIAGILVLVCAVLVRERRSFGIVLFWLVFLGTALWSLWEVGLNGWALMPRLVFLCVAGLWLLFLSPQDGVMPRRRAALLSGLVIVAAAAVALFALLPPSNGNPGAAPSLAAGGGDWSHYGGS